MDADLIVKMTVIAAVLVLWWVLSDWSRYRDRAVRAGRVLHLTRPPPPALPGPPIQQIAADLRRIRAQIDDAQPGVPVARRRGWLAAYDDVLVQACRALGLEEHLRAVPEGGARAVERARVERVLADAGVRMRPSS